MIINRYIMSLINHYYISTQSKLREKHNFTETQFTVYSCRFIGACRMPGKGSPIQHGHVKHSTVSLYLYQLYYEFHFTLLNERNRERHWQSQLLGFNKGSAKASQNKHI